MRLFVGIDLPDAVTAAIDQLIRKLKPAADLRWSPAANLHITTKFIGDWPEPRLYELKRALEGVHAPPVFEIAIRGLGWFPNPHHPRVFFAPVEGGEPLLALARATDEATSQLGVPKEERKYSPHLTLTRVKEGASLVELRRAVAALESVDFGTFRAAQYHLYLSKPGAGGSVYTKLATYPLPATIH